LKLLSSQIHPVRKGKPMTEGEITPKKMTEGENKAIHNTLIRIEIEPHRQEIEKLGDMKKRTEQLRKGSNLWMHAAIRMTGSISNECLILWKSCYLFVRQATSPIRHACMRSVFSSLRSSLVCCLDRKLKSSYGGR
jgi:hypothetical protein